MTYVKRIVKRLIRKYGTRNPFEICDHLGIKLIFKDLGHVRGAFQIVYRTKIIYINYNLEHYMQRQVCAHELAHAILHRKVNTIFLDKHTYFVTDKLEIEANIFAAELLISDDNIRQYFGTGYSIENIANDLEISETLVEYKIKNLSCDCFQFFNKL